MAKSGVGRAVAVLSVLTGISVLLGFGRDVVMAIVFGTSAELDAYFVAQGLMNLVLGLVTSAMAKAIVPAVARDADSVDGTASVHHSVTVAISTALTVLGLASIVMWLAAGSVVTVLAPGFDTADHDVAVSLTRIVLIAVVLVAGTNLLAALANGHREFFWSGVQGIPFNLVMIVAAGVFGPRYGVAALAAGFVVGSATRFLCQFVPLRRIGYRLRVSFDLTNPGFRQMARMVPPLLLGSAITNVNTMVDRAVGSLVGDGVISALSYAWRLVTLPETLIVAALLTAIYPAFGAAARNPAELRRLVGRGLSTLMVVVTPLCACLMVAATPLVTVVFQHGNFSAADTANTATAVLWYTPALLAMGWREIIIRASYAVGDTRWPVLVALLAMAVNVVGDFTLGLAFGIAGLAASTSLAVGLAAAANTWMLARHHRGVDIRPLAGMMARTTGAAALGAVVATVSIRLLDGWLNDGWLWALGIATGTGVVVSGLFVAVLAVLRAPELTILRDALRMLARR